MKLTKRQEQIIDIIKANEPIRSKDIAEQLGIAQITVRQDLAILTSLGRINGKPNFGYCISEKEGLNLSEQIGNIIVKDVMRKSVTVVETTSVYDASIEMIIKDKGTLYVNDAEGALVGVLSRKDLLKGAIHKQDIRTLPVAAIMTRKPLFSVKPDDYISTATKIIVEKAIDSVPVVDVIDGKEVVIGTITKTSLSEEFLKLLTN